MIAILLVLYLIKNIKRDENDWLYILLTFAVLACLILKR